MPKATKPVQPATLIRRAKRILKEKGWQKGNFQNIETGAVCILGALRIAAFGEIDDFSFSRDHPDYPPYWTAVNAIEMCVRASDEYYSSIPSMNDDEKTTLKDINNYMNCGIKRITEETR